VEQKKIYCIFSDPIDPVDLLRKNVCPSQCHRHTSLPYPSLLSRVTAFFLLTTGTHGYGISWHKEEQRTGHITADSYWRHYPCVLGDNRYYLSGTPDYGHLRE